MAVSSKMLTSLVVGSLLILPAGLSKDEPKVDLTLKSIDGRRVRLKEYRGKIVVVNFWATWCGPCNAEMPILVEKDREYGSRGVVFIAASLDDAKSRKQIPAFVERHQVRFPVWVGASGEDLDRLGMGLAVPSTAFLDRDGRIVFRVLGSLQAKELQKRLDWLINARIGPRPATLLKSVDGP
jgi:thiol-disulfide isomerase/thioredoxin